MSNFLHLRIVSEHGFIFMFQFFHLVHEILSSSLSCQDSRGVYEYMVWTACFCWALNSNGLLPEWQTQQMLTLSNAHCLSSPCFCPVMALRRGEQPGHLTLSDWETVCVCEQAWMCMCMLQIDLPLVCHIKLALCWPPSCLQAVPYIPQLSLATLRTSFVPWQKKKVNNYNSWLCFKLPYKIVSNKHLLWLIRKKRRQKSAE